jgi:hypothetical protein
MRVFTTILAAACLVAVSVADARAAPPRAADLSRPDLILAWINTYRAKLDPQAVPAAVKALSRLGALRDPENAGVYVGFVAGVLGANPGKAASLVERMLPLPEEDQWFVVRAIAFSGLPGWKDLLRDVADRLPSRRALIGKYVEGAMPTPFDLARESEPSAAEKVRRYVLRDERRVTTRNWALDASPELLDAFWGQYFATGGYGPITRIVAMLPWSKDKDHVEKLMLGAMAKFTLARNASRDTQLLAMLRRMAPHQDKETAPVLKDVIEAADMADTARIRSEAMASLENLKRHGPGSRREMATWGKVGEGVIGLGCVAAAATGQVALGLPCVLGGAATSAAVRYLSQ